ncbi:hypothetical protein GJ629_12680 [Halapricum sp. CBA1109]|uniref:hypothetical protein n=1 Tax=Halapricum sp. CBA1109 TaxID=2668068 RepID=UPI0012F84801|nr:hypothetical protein [Halapricum sp. CBA1109]MUV90645.1 hypothetical protein [Halapricum sp. CBA1109]
MEPLAAVVLQFADPFEPSGGVDVAVNLGGGALSAALTTLIVGAILVAIAPEYTVRKMDELRENVVESFFWGLFLALALGIVIVALFFSLIGIPAALVVGLVALVAWAVGAAIAFLAIADRLVDREDGWLIPLLVAAGLNGGLTLTGIGGILSFCIGAAGFGAVLRDYL